MTTGVTVHGRVLARNGAVTLDTDTITKPQCLQPTATPSATVSPTPTVTSKATPTAKATTTKAAPATTTTVVPTATTSQVVKVPTGSVQTGDGSTVPASHRLAYGLSAGLVLTVGTRAVAVRRRRRSS